MDELAADGYEPRLHELSGASLALDGRGSITPA
jgi:hypothetical protein